MANNTPPVKWVPLQAPAAQTSATQQSPLGLTWTPLPTAAASAPTPQLTVTWQGGDTDHQTTVPAVPSGSSTPKIKPGPQKSLT